MDYNTIFVGMDVHAGKRCKRLCEWRGLNCYYSREQWDQVPRLHRHLANTARVSHTADHAGGISGLRIYL